MKTKLLLLILLAVTILNPQRAFAQDKATVSSSNFQIPNVKQTGFDSRV